MKVKFRVTLKGKDYEEILEINEEQFKKCEGYQARNLMNNIASDWVNNVIESEYQVVEDDRFDNCEDNLPYLDWVTKQRLGWK